MANTNLRCVEFCTWFSAKFAHFGSRRFLAALFSWVVSAAIAGLLAFGCGGSSPTVTSITVSPSPAALITGTSQNTQQFKATGNLSDGTTNDLTRLVVWSSSNTSAATIQSNTGMATAAGDGVTTITATYGSGSSAPTASAVLTVNLGSVTVTPPNPSILVSATQQFAATAAYLDRTTSDVTQAATWSSSNPSFATMSTTTPGLATGVSVGDSNITATVGSTQSNQAVLAVTSGSPTLTGISLAPTSDSVMVGMTVQYTATGTYSDGSTQDVTTQATWASSSSGVATISNSAGSQGLATAVAAGSTNISATIGSVSGNAMLTVTPKVVTNASRYQLSLGLTNLYVDAIVPTTGQLRAVSFLDVNNGLNYNRGLLTHPNGQVVYLVSIPSIGLQVATYSLSPSGQLAPVGSPITSQNYQGVPIIDPIGRFLYLEDDSQDIVVFPLDPNTGVPGTASNAAAAVPSPGLMAIDSTGTYLFVQTGATLSSYQINGTTGALTAIGSPTNAASSIGALVVTPSGKSIYELDGATHSIYGFSISKGALTPLTNSPFAVPATGDPLQMAVDPSGSFLYLTEQSADGLFGFTIGGNGSLSAMQGGASFAIGSGPNLLNADASGKFLYVSNAFTNEVWTYAIGSGTGLLTKSSQMRDQGTTAQALANGTALTFTPTAMFLAIESGDVAQFSINSSTGELAPMSTPLLGAGVEPQTVVTDPYDLFAYSPSLKASNLVSFSISSDGLSLIAAPTTSTGTSWATTDLSGTYLYVSNQTQSSVEQYTLSSGVPTGGQAAAVTDSGPSFITVDPTGQFVYVAASATGTAGFIDAFTIHAGGLLSNVASVQAGQSQKWIAIDPSGRFAYTADPLSNLIWEFTINDSTGQLAANSTPSVSVGATGAIPGSNTVVVEPSGRFAYAANQSLNQVFGFSISPSTGLLTPLNSGSALASTGTDPVALGVDISGQFLYCTNQGSNDISIFSINPSTGALTQVGTGTVQAGDTQPYGFALTGTRQ